MRALDWENKIVSFMKSSSPPTLRETSPVYATLTQQRDDLLAEQTALRVELIALAHRLDESSGEGSPGQNAAAARIASILGEPSTQLGQSDRERYLTVSQRIADINAALEILAGRITSERMRASAIIRDQVEGEHKHLVADICAKLASLHEASAKYTEFANALNADNVAWSALEPMFPKFLSGPTDKNGNVARYLREAVLHGFISATSIPASLKEKSR